MKQLHGFVQLFYQLASKKKDFAYLRLLTDSLLVPDVCQLSTLKNCPPDLDQELRIIFLDTLVEWIFRFSHIFRSPSYEKRTETYIDVEVNKAVVETLSFLENLVDYFSKSKSLKMSSAVTAFLKHIRFVACTASKHAYSWIDYCNKLRVYCDKLLECIQLAHPSPLTSQNRIIEDSYEDTSSMSENLDLLELKKLILQEMSKTNENYKNVSPYQMDPNSFITLYRNACDQSNIIQIIQNIQRDYENKNISIITTQAHNHDDDDEKTSTLANMQQHLLKLSSLFITWYSLRQYGNKLPGSENNVSTAERSLTRSQSTFHYSVTEDSSDDVSLSSTNQNCNEQAERSCKVRSKKLVNKSCFNEFCGSVLITPPSTPAPEETSRKYVINLPKEDSKSRRIPWTVEESIALWHGVMHDPGSKNWSQIWRQSFRHSNRNQVNLKDRWRVIHDNVTIRNTVRRAYDRWRAQFKNNKRSPVKNIHLPMPIIVRTS